MYKDAWLTMGREDWITMRAAELALPDEKGDKFDALTAKYFATVELLYLMLNPAEPEKVETKVELHYTDPAFKLAQAEKLVAARDAECNHLQKKVELLKEEESKLREEVDALRLRSRDKDTQIDGMRVALDLAQEEYKRVAYVLGQRDSLLRDLRAEARRVLKREKASAVTACGVTSTAYYRLACDVAGETPEPGPYDRALEQGLPDFLPEQAAGASDRSVATPAPEPGALTGEEIDELVRLLREIPRRVCDFSGECERWADRIAALRCAR